MEYENNTFKDTVTQVENTPDSDTQTAGTENLGAEADGTNTGYRASADGRQNTGAFQPPPPSMAMNGPRRLYRSTGPVGGVAAGMAEYFSIDPVLVRLGIVAGSIVGFPLVPLVYVAAWMIIPQADPVPVAPIMAPNPPTQAAPATTTTVVHPDAPAPSSVSPSVDSPSVDSPSIDSPSIDSMSAR